MRRALAVVLLLLAAALAGCAASPAPSMPVAQSGPLAKTPAPATSPEAAKKTAPAAPARKPNLHRTVTFVNRLKQTVWVASGEQAPKPALPVSGWKLKPGKRLTIKVPDAWNGRFWGRTGCKFNSEGRGHCETGDCAGRFQCRQYGGIPATLAEFKFNTWHNLDFYDVSMVDGANIPLWINIAAGRTKDPVNAKGCSPRGCVHKVICPKKIQVAKNSRTVGCISACARLKTDQYCCRGKWSARSACDPRKWPVDYAALFKKAQPYAYSYVYDDATSTFTCAGTCGYRITFGTTP
jgi:hypothetical protein